MNIFINKKEQRLKAGWRLLVQFIIMFFITRFAFLALQSVWQSPLSIAAAIPGFLGVVASIWIAAKLLDKRSITDYGLRFNRRWLADFIAGVLIAGVAIITIFGVEWMMEWISISGFGWKVSSDVPFMTAILSSFFAMLMIGFYEELFSRGYQILNLTEGLRFPQIGERGAVAIAVLIASALFGVLHFYNPNASAISTFNIILAGVALAVPYVLTGSLALSIGLHFSWNFVQGGIFGFPVSGMNFETSVVQIEQYGADLWTGGAFGPEAGLVGILGMAIIVGLSLVYIKTVGYKLSIALSRNFREEGEIDC